MIFEYGLLYYDGFKEVHDIIKQKKKKNNIYKPFWVLMSCPEVLSPIRSNFDILSGTDDKRASLRDK